jgi:hypothetical protein
VTVTCHDYATYGGVYRLAATLLDRRAYPAGALMTLYRERREHEIACFALRRTLLHGRVLRSQDPAGDPTGDIGRAVLAGLHGPRRPRVCARKVKSPLSRWSPSRSRSAVRAWTTL